MRLWQVWALLGVVLWLLTAAAVYVTAQAGYVVLRLASILTLNGG